MMKGIDFIALGENRHYERSSLVDKSLKGRFDLNSYVGCK